MGYFIGVCEGGEVKWVGYGGVGRIVFEEILGDKMGYVGGEVRGVEEF